MNSICWRSLGIGLVAVVAIAGTTRSARAADLVITADTTLGADIACTETPCLIVDADDVVVDGNGHSITCADSSSVGVVVAGRSRVVLHNLEIRNCALGVDLKQPSSDNTLESLVLREVDSGIYGEAGVRQTVRDCSVEAAGPFNRGQGIHFFGGSDLLIAGNVVTGFQNGIRLTDGATRSSVVSNTANENVDGIRIEDSTRILVRMNTTLNNGSIGIFLIGSTDNRVLVNTATGNGFFGTFDLFDASLPLCLNVWAGNTFVTDNEEEGRCIR